MAPRVAGSQIDAGIATVNAIDSPQRPIVSVMDKRACSHYYNTFLQTSPAFIYFRPLSPLPLRGVASRTRLWFTSLPFLLLLPRSGAYVT